MPPLGWRKAVDGAKAKGKQTADPPVYNNPPAVPERSAASVVALGGTSLPPRRPTSLRLRPPEDWEDENSTMDVDNPSEDSTPAPAPMGSSSDHTSNTGMTPPIRSIKLKLKVKPALADSSTPEPPAPVAAPTRGRGRGRGRGGRGRGRGRGRGGHARKIIAALSPSPSSEEESPPEEPAPLESEDEASDAASEQDAPNITLNTVTDDLDEDEDLDAEAEVDPDATGDMDEDIDELDLTGAMDPDPEDEMDELSFSAANRSKLTARQAALVAGGSTATHVMLPEAPSRKAQRTEAELALRRSETARKRKHQDAQRLEDEKTETINRLLKKQSVKARNKKALETPVGETPGDETGAVTPEYRPAVPCYRWVSSATSLTFALPDVSNSPELVLALEPAQQPVIRPAATCAVSGCSLQRKYRLPGAASFETGACGMEHLKLLKTQ
ncbi:PAPA-1 domain protein [Ceratobasidium sp. AG-Ba]|nr:PAPA-1 domain protein [Ceratobasidium sp. AG-Ba]